jgi:uncharacterized protein (TIGR03083 family)
VSDACDSGAVRSSFHGAVDGFVELVGAVPAGRFDDPALGTWTVRDLIGHASRALSTIEDYCGRESDGPIVDGPAEYFTLAGASPPGSDARRKRDESIAERGKQAGAALGDEPATAVRALAERVTALVDATEDEMPMATAAGRMTLVGYLPTRTFELVVHGLDLAGALGLRVPPALGPAIAASTALAGEIAAARPEAPLVLLALCGRRNLPATFSVA